jgi:A/G-specific adenine glycosylase
VRHAYSHFKLDLRLFRAGVEACGLVAEGTQTWLPVAELPSLALHGAHQKAVKFVP